MLHSSASNTATIWLGTVAAPYGRPDQPDICIPGRAVTVPVDTIAYGLELMLSPVSHQNTAPGGEGSQWNGIHTLQDPMDSAALSAVLWRIRPNLILEIGTECGGSALFFASIMERFETPGVVLTYDIKMWRCGARKTKRWREYVDRGLIVPRVADVTAEAERRFVHERMHGAAVVMVIDDGNHFTTPLLVHFHMFADYVTSGSYYLLQDTRLERTCRSQKAMQKQRNITMWQYCSEILGSEGGPARAVRYLECESGQFQRHFVVDRSPEGHVYTGHPGGWLLRTA